MASRLPTQSNSLDMDLTCSICIEAFQDPVTTTCGHSFCNNCLHHNLSLNGTMCPLCKKHLNCIPEVNIVLRNIVEEMKKKRKREEVKDPREFSGKPGEVPCDCCPQPKMKATKSCLVCLSSYCDDHINNHSSNKRFKGHQLVNPVENLDERACLTHGRPLELYSRMQQKCICVLCMKEDDGDGLVSTEDEWGRKKAELEKTIEELKEKIQERIKKKDEINTSLKSCKDKLDSEWWDIEAIFTAVMLIVDTSVSFGSMRKIPTTLMQQIQLELETFSSIELQRLPNFTVDVRLDPSTSHRRLILSEDQKGVIDGGTAQEVKDDLERFDVFGSVLGSDKLSSARSYWEVEVGNKGGWDLGVAAGKANRNGRLTLSPDTGYWAIVHYEENKYAALTAPLVCLELKEKPEKVGVFVDSDEGLVSFYDVTAQRHIYSYSDQTFTEEIFPYFSPHVKTDNNAEPLIISSVKDSC